ncbi:hypothetical protein ACFFLZ_04385 [Photobacterium aphoticum]|uniref:hypothetical protein n=1 Tax=Photobacterium aphoticum TaxID=754436 RepID=UPI000B1E732C|nr:hypothetical protein [Photobacterium aphoticum]
MTVLFWKALFLKAWLLLGLFCLSSTAWATGGGLGGLPSPTTPFMTVAVCLDKHGKPLPRTQHQKQTRTCNITGNETIDTINRKKI